MKEKLKIKTKQNAQICETFEKEKNTFKMKTKRAREKNCVCVCVCKQRAMNEQCKRPLRRRSRFVFCANGNIF